MTSLARSIAPHPSTVFGGAAPSLLLLLSLLFIGGASCTKSKVEVPDLAVEVTVTPAPPRVGPVVVRVRPTHPDGRSVLGAEVEVEGTMRHPGMKPELATASENPAGEYTAPLRLTMAGDWVLLIRVRLPGGAAIEHAHMLPAVRSEPP